MKLSIIIPAYNEEKRIQSTLFDYYNYFKRIYKDDFEIIVVCDGCKDRTPEIVKDFGKKNVKLLEFPNRLGKGGGVIEGFKVAKGSIIGFTDADGSTSAEEFEKILNYIGKYDCAIGSRATKGSKLLVKQTIIRRFLGWIFRNYVNLLFNLGIKDTQCGAKVFKKEVKSIINHMKIKGFAFDVELLYRLKNNGFSIIEVPIKWRNCEESKVRFKHVFDMFWTLLKFRFSS